LVSLKVSHELAVGLGQYEALMGLAEAIFGSSKKTGKKPLPKPISGPEELARVVARMGGKMGS
jgi:hypothetical protein